MKEIRASSKQLTDGFEKIAHGIPYDHEHAEMSYKQLAIELQKHKTGSAAYLVVQREMKLKEDPSFFKKPWFIWLSGLVIAIFGLAAKFLP